MTVKEQETTGTQPVGSPNDDYKNNPLLDENGNPKTPSKDTQPSVEVKPEATPAVEPTVVALDESDAPPAPDKTDWSKLESVQKLEKFLVDAGLKPSEVTKEVIANDGKITTEVLKALEDKYGAGVASLLTEQVVELYKRGEAIVKQQEDAIFSQVKEAFADLTDQDGETTFKELSQWAKTNVAQEARKELNVMLSAGGLQAQLAINYLVGEFKGADSYQQPAKLITADGVSTQSTVVPLTRAQYRNQLDKLLAKGHGENSPEVISVNKARQLGMARGI